MKISLILPTRGRPSKFDWFCRAAIGNAFNPGDVEIIARLDDDDPALTAYSPPGGCEFVVGPRGKGYPDNGKMINEAARASTGNLLMQVVDDCEIVTKNWDLKYQSAAATKEDEIFVLASKVVGCGDFPFSFPVISRRLYELCGMFALDEFTSVDRCWEAFSRFMDCAIYTDVEIRHGVLGDDTSKQGRGPWCEQLDKKWDTYQPQIDRIGRKYADLVRAKTCQSTSTQS